MIRHIVPHASRKVIAIVDSTSRLRLTFIGDEQQMHMASAVASMDDRET
jgi:hypothetical protein